MAGSGGHAPAVVCTGRFGGSSPEGLQRIAGGKQSAAPGNGIKCDSTPNGGGRKRDSAGKSKSGTPFGVLGALCGAVPVVARAYHRLFSGTPIRGVVGGRRVWKSLTMCPALKPSGLAENSRWQAKAPPPEMSLLPGTARSSSACPAAWMHTP